MGGCEPIEFYQMQHYPFKVRPSLNKAVNRVYKDIEISIFMPVGIFVKSGYDFGQGWKKSPVAMTLFAPIVYPFKLIKHTMYHLLYLGDALLFSSESDQAQEAYRNAVVIAQSDLEVNPRNAESLYGMAWATAMLGDMDAAERFIDRAKSIDSTNPLVQYYDALLKTARKDYDAALTALRIAVDSGYPAIMLENEPHLLDLRGSEQFLSIISAPRKD